MKAAIPDWRMYESVAACGCQRTWFVEKPEDEAVFVAEVHNGEISPEQI